MLLKQSTARNRLILMIDSADHITGKAGLTLTITASKDGGAFASITPTVTDRGNGWYALALTSGHTDTLGDLALHITGTAADPTDLVDQVVVELPQAVPTNFATLSIDSNGRVKAQVEVIKNQALSGFMFYMTDSATHTPKTGLVDANFTKKYAIDGGAAGTLSGTITELDAVNLPGFYVINLSASELNGNTVALRFSASGADTTALTICTAQ